MKRLMLWRLYASRSEPSSTFNIGVGRLDLRSIGRKNAAHAGGSSLGHRSIRVRERWARRRGSTVKAFKMTRARPTFARAHGCRFGGGAVLLRILILGWNWTCR